jgi:hypothetical protein
LDLRFPSAIAQSVFRIRGIDSRRVLGVGIRIVGSVPDDAVGHEVADEGRKASPGVDLRESHTNMAP